jgi:hypothetical protein
MDRLEDDQETAETQAVFTVTSALGATLGGAGLLRSSAVMHLVGFGYADTSLQQIRQFRRCGPSSLQLQPVGGLVGGGLVTGDLRDVFLGVTAVVGGLIAGIDESGVLTCIVQIFLVLWCF